MSHSIAPPKTRAELIDAARSGDLPQMVRYEVNGRRVLCANFPALVQTVAGNASDEHVRAMLAGVQRALSTTDSSAEQWRRSRRRGKGKPPVRTAPGRR